MIRLTVAVIFGIATPAISDPSSKWEEAMTILPTEARAILQEEKEKAILIAEEAMTILRTMAQADSLLEEIGLSDQALAEQVKAKEPCAAYVTQRMGADILNNQIRIALSIGFYENAAEVLQESLDRDPRQQALFEVLEKVATENVKLLDMIVSSLDISGQKADAEKYRRMANDRRLFAEAIKTALEPLRE